MTSSISSAYGLGELVDFNGLTIHVVGITSFRCIPKFEALGFTVFNDIKPKERERLLKDNPVAYIGELFLCEEDEAHPAGNMVVFTEV